MLIQRNTASRNKWPINNTTSGLLAALILSSGGLMGQFESTVMAQGPARAVVEGKLDAPLVDWSHAQHIYRLSEKWIAQGNDAPVMDGPVIEVTGMAGVRVTIRWGGLRLGTGQATLDQLTPVRGNAYDLTQAARLAVRGAMLEVEESLRQSARRATVTTQPTEGESVSRGPAKITDLTGQLLVDIQIACQPQVIRIPADAAPGTIYRRFVPGFHGLRMTTRSHDGTPLSSWVWPADSLAAGLPPTSQVYQLMGGIGMKLGELNNVGKPGSPVLERFEVIHMVRPSATEPITRLIRGNVMLPPSSVDGRTVDNMTLRLVDHLRSRMREDGRFLGTYLPSSDTYQVPVARRDNAALAILALSRWTQSGIVPAGDPRIHEVNETVRQWINANLPEMLGAEENSSTTALSLTLMILSENPALDARQTERDQVAHKLLSLRNADGSFRASTDEKAGLADEPASALVVNSLAAYYSLSRDAATGQALANSMEWVWERVDPLKSMGALPWLLEADARLEAFTAPDGSNPMNPRGPRGARLARLMPTLDIIMSRQIVAPPEVGPADVVGGFLLRDLEEGDAPNPDWRAAHMMMILSQSLRNPDLFIARQRLEALLACGRAARFLGQLMFDEPGAFYVRSPDDVVGGVRPMLWDNRLDLSPTAMTLLACCDLRKTLQQWESQR